MNIAALPSWVLAAVVAMAMAVASAAPSAARDDGWVVLGKTTADTRIDRDEVNVGPNNGRFESLRIEASDNDVFIQDIVVTSYEGGEQTFRIGQVVRVGQALGPIELRGRLQTVRNVVFTYRASGRVGSGRSTVTLLGERRRDDDRVGDRGRLEFEPIDTQTADRRTDRIVFRTERGEGRLSHIRLRSVRDAVRIGEIIIVFANGDRQTVPAYMRLEPGQATEAIAVELTRERRRIDEIIVEKRPSFRRDLVEIELSGARVRLDRDDDGRPGYDTHSGAPSGGWVLFGSQQVGFGVDRDVIRVGREAGMFEKIALRVLKNDIYLREITLVFGNGERQRVSVNSQLREGFRTAPLPLERGDRFIDQIELVYQSRPDRRGEAVVEVWGDYSERWLRDADARRGRGDGWVLLGAQRAEMFGNDRDAFEVGERFGRFKSVRVAAKRRAVKVNGLRITYGNGETENVPIRAELRDGQSTEPIDLKGRGRFIQRIEMSYRTKLNFKGEGVVEVWGLQ